MKYKIKKKYHYDIKCSIMNSITIHILGRLCPFSRKQFGPFIFSYLLFRYIIIDCSTQSRVNSENPLWFEHLLSFITFFDLDIFHSHISILGSRKYFR